MVVFVNFDDEAEDPLGNRGIEPAGFAGQPLPLTNDGSIAFVAGVASRKREVAVFKEPERPNPNLNVVSEALGCYPSALTSAIAFVHSTSVVH